MWSPAIVVANLVVVASAQQFFKWNTPRANLAADDVYRRQSTPPGYSPEFAGCGSGKTCEAACGRNWESCQASTTLSLFCYNKVDLNQTCCGNGSGRACDSGYYCAWELFGGKVWCCEDGQSLEECGVSQGTSSATSPPTSSGGPSSSTSSSSTPTTTSGTAASSRGETLSTSESQCRASTVTSLVTTTVISTINIAATTVTVTAPGGECSSSTSLSRSVPPYGTSETGTITEPPSPSSTSHRPPIYNSTITQSIVTGGGPRGVMVNSLGSALALLPLLWL